ncbi:6-carboxytetrahydropterin synthase [Limnohabitans sp.]|uniref:6-pyruvoyl trahydropterin synthase family protein n=1 Tax=Limnohabitans sp. TaxID=1907725 RepID=UPI00286F369E|nr:6-carboxytetrahydropterin synthase [Limnohabitans sp.]
MKFELSQRFYFEAAHTLRRKIDAAGSLRIHGHTYHAEVTLAGKPDPESGMMMDLGFLRQEVGKVREKLDHHFLDEVAGIGPATLENLCAFIYNDLKSALPNIQRITIERPASGDKCSLMPNDNI